MQITIPDRPELINHATKAGFASVEAYVRHLIELDVQRHPQPSQKSDWKHSLDEFVSTLTPGVKNVDDSRESIYGERLDRQM